MIELLIVTAVSVVLLAGFTSFYLSEQRTFRHHQLEIETSQELRTALDQMSRDIRLAGRNFGALLYPFTFTGFTFANATRVDLRFDTNDDQDYSDAGETREYRTNSGNLESCDPGNLNCEMLARNATLALTYVDCDGNPTVPNADTTELAKVARVDISLTATRTKVGGLPVSRSEADSVQVRNSCPKPD